MQAISLVILLPLSTALAMGVSGCALDGATDSGGESATTTQYEDIADFDYGAWYDVRDKLSGEFAAECSSTNTTLCAGEYRHITSLGMTCSVTTKVGNVHDCVWTFAATEHAIDPKTAAISIDLPSFQCPIHPKATVGKLEALLGGSADALHETLPGTTTSIADALADCFQHPIGATPVTASSDSSPTYIDANGYYSSASYKARWEQTKAALELGFDNVCGDTFCGGDYGNMQSLEFTCAVTASNGNIKSCSWVFAGSYALPDKKGNEVVSAKSWRCTVPVKGTLSQLMTVVTATNTTATVLNRPLPGGTATAYDALLNCL